MKSSSRKSLWTRIYWDTNPTTGTLQPYIRLAPTFMEVEKSGFPHGISIGAGFFETKEKAIKAANNYDKFFDELVKSIPR